MKSKKVGGMSVNVERLRPNEWNFNEMAPFMYEKLLLSIKEDGFIERVLVRYIPKDDIYEIIDGEHRWRALKELHDTGISLYTTPAKDELLKRGKVRVENIGIVPDDIAKRISIKMNELKGRPNAERLGTVLKDLRESETDVSALPYEDEDIDSLIAAVEYDWDKEVFDTVAKAELPEPSSVDTEDDAKVGVMLSKLLSTKNFPIDQAQEFRDRFIKLLKIEGIARIDAWQGLFILLRSYEKEN